MVHYSVVHRSLYINQIHGGYKMKNLINAFIIYVFMMLMLLAVCFVIKLFGFTGVVFGVFGFSVLLAKIMVWR